MSGRKAKAQRRAQGPEPDLIPGRRQSSVRILEGERRSIVTSDRKGEHYGTCLLCRNHTRLQLSHIAPKWAAQWTKAEGGVIGNYPSVGVITFEQDYSKHYMLCADCEQYFGTAEKYMSSICRGTPPDIQSIGVVLDRDEDGTVLKNVNVGMLLRGVFGIAFKANYAKTRESHSVRLPSWSIDELRSALQHDDYPASRFSLLAYRLMNRTIPGANPRAHLSMRATEARGCIAFILHMAGWVFVAIIGNTSKNTFDEFHGSFVNAQDSVWRVGSAEMCLEPHVNPEGIASYDNLVPTNLVSLADPCPCGMHLKFGECCAGRWVATRYPWLEMQNKATRQLSDSRQ